MFSEISLKLEETFPSWLTFIFNPYGLTDKSSAIIFLFIKFPSKNWLRWQEIVFRMELKWSWRHLTVERLWDGLMLVVVTLPAAMLVLWCCWWCHGPLILPSSWLVWAEVKLECDSPLSSLSQTAVTSLPPLLGLLASTESSGAASACRGSRPVTTPQQHQQQQQHGQHTTALQHQCPLITVLVVLVESVCWLQSDWLSDSEVVVWCGVDWGLSACWSPVLPLRMTTLHSLPSWGCQLLPLSSGEPELSL